MKRTIKQNKALHLLFDMMAKELNNNGLTVQKTLKKDFELWWTSELIKNAIWRPIQKAMFGIESTKDIETKHIDQIFDVINKHLGEKHHLHIPFPSADELIEYYENTQKMGKRSN